MSKKMNIVIIGLGTIGSYFYNYIKKNKKTLFNKTNTIPNILFVSAKSLKKKKKSIYTKKTLVKELFISY
jgi:homoserine dehydrogenase